MGAGAGSRNRSKSRSRLDLLHNTADTSYHGNGIVVPSIADPYHFDMDPDQGCEKICY